MKSNFLKKKYLLEVSCFLFPDYIPKTHEINDLKLCKLAVVGNVNCQ